MNERLHGAVNDGLAKKWSPRQISRRLRTDFPADDTMRVSHETIYQTLYLQARGELRTQLKLALRSGRARRVPRSRTAVATGKIRDMINISERPPEAADRAVPGFWEGDLIVGKANRSQIATLVERTTRFVMLVRIPYDRTAERVASLLARKMQTLPEFLRKSITWDQGKEMADHAQFTIKTGIDVYFAAATRTPTVCSVNTSRKAPTSRSTPSRNSTPSPTNSTTVHARHLAGSNPPKYSTNY
jgi:IS30 family transposase